MREIVSLDPGNELWKPKMRMVKWIFTDHFKIEEDQALPLLEKHHDDERLDIIERDFLSIEENLLHR